MLRWLLPRAAILVIFVSAAFFAFFESVYLRDQAAEFGDGKITLWMWTFRGITAALVLSGVAVMLRK